MTSLDKSESIRLYMEWLEGQIVWGENMRKFMESLYLNSLLYGINTVTEQDRLEMLRCLKKDNPTLSWLSEDPIVEVPKI